MTDARRAIEALRAGVPNRAAIRMLGTAENALAEAFAENLRECRQGLQNGEQAIGQIVAGDFGTGKSHLLGYLQELALAENFIVSWVVISKENPLFDLRKLYRSAFRNAVAPKRNDDGMTAALARLRPKSDEFDDLELWAQSSAANFSPVFPALMYLLRNAAPEQTAHIARFFSGEVTGLTTIKQWLKEAGVAKRFAFKKIKDADLAQQRLRFVPRLIAAAGYSGWVLLLDEVELVARYSVLQRGRSYAELARWLGLDAENAPGVVTVATITPELITEVIGKRRDDEQAPLKLANKNERKTAERARIGLEALEKQSIKLQNPTIEHLAASLLKIRSLYSEAYGWEPPMLQVGEVSNSKSMRQHIKSWITTWDLARLYQEQAEIETSELAPDYEENRELEQTVEEDDGSEDNVTGAAEGK